MAKGPMTTNSTVDVIDKTLRVDGAPADAKATGAELEKKVNKDLILDSDGNVIFYSKAAVDEMLAGKQNVLTDVDKGDIVRTGLTSDGLLSEDEKNKAQSALGLRGKYEKITEFTLESAVTRVNLLSDVSLLGVIVGVKVPSNDTFTLFMGATSNSGESAITNTDAAIQNYEYSCALSAVVDHGTLTVTGQGAVPGWGGGPVKGKNDAAKIVFSDYITTVWLYTTSREIPSGCKIIIYGVKK